MKQMLIPTVTVTLLALGCSSDKDAKPETSPKASETTPSDTETEAAPETAPEPPPAVVERIALLDKYARDPQRNQKIVDSFSEFGAEAVAPLVARIGEIEGLEKVYYVAALAEIGEPALEPLARYLGDSDFSLAHVDICKALAKLGPKARSARDVVAERAEDFPAGIKKECGKALAAIDK